MGGGAPKNLYLEVRQALQAHGYREYGKRVRANVGTTLVMWRSLRAYFCLEKRRARYNLSPPCPLLRSLDGRDLSTLFLEVPGLCIHCCRLSRAFVIPIVLVPVRSVPSLAAQRSLVHVKFTCVCFSPTCLPLIMLHLLSSRVLLQKLTRTSRSL